MEYSEIPKKELRTKKLIVSLTEKEHENYMKLCSKIGTSLSDLVRYLLNKLVSEHLNEDKNKGK